MYVTRPYTVVLSLTNYDYCLYFLIYVVVIVVSWFWFVVVVLSSHAHTRSLSLSTLSRAHRHARTHVRFHHIRMCDVCTRTAAAAVAETLFVL